LEFVATGIPFLAAIPLLFKSSTLQLISEYWWEPRGKIDGLTYVIEVYSDIAAFALVGIVVAACAWALRRNLLRVHRLFWALFAISGLIYLVMPHAMFPTTWRISASLSLLSSCLSPASTSICGIELCAGDL
jgi:hypothetical protein